MPNKRRELSLKERTRAVTLHEEGYSQRDIARKIGASKTAVLHIIQKYRATGTTVNTKGRGRRRLSSARDDRVLVRASLANRRATSLQLKRLWTRETGIQCSSRTVRNRLLERNLRSYKARKKPFVNNRQRNQRLQWAKDHRNWTNADWQKVMFTDESNFELFPTPGHVMVRRRPGEAFKPECLVPTVKHGGGSIMVWGALTSTGVGVLKVCGGRMNSVSYCQVLEQAMLPSARQLFPQDQDWVFQQDNAPCHTSRVSRQWLQDHNVSVLPWPSQSPDMNPIENLWDLLGRAVQEHKPSSKRELENILMQEWSKISQDTCQKLVGSMQSRVQALIMSKGWPTKY